MPNSASSESASTPHVQLITKPGCHLCEDAKAVVAKVTAGLGLGWDEVDAAADPVLMDRYAEEIPVLMVDGVQRDFWRIDPARLTRLLS